MHPAVLLWVNSFCRAWVQQISTSNTQLCFVQMKKKSHNLIFTQVLNSLKSWVSSSQFLSTIFSFSDGLVILSYIWESWWRRIAWQPEGQYAAIRKPDSSKDMVNNSSNFLTVICCMHTLQVKWFFWFQVNFDLTCVDSWFPLSPCPRRQRTLRINLG